MGLLVLGVVFMSRNIVNRRRTRSGIKMWVGIVICLVLLSCFPEEIMSFSPGVEQLRRTDMVSPYVYVNILWLR